jgi:hypothetical protein
MKQWLRDYRQKLRRWYFQRNYYFAKLLPPEVPRRPLSFLHDGFAVNSIGNSGVRVIERFCSVAGASYLTSRAAEIGGEDTLSAVVFSATHQDPVLMPLLYRLSMLTGTAINQVGPIEVGLVSADLKVCPLEQPPVRQSAKPLYALHIFLDDAGELEFPELGVAVTAATGRAVFWPLKRAADGRYRGPVCRYNTAGSDRYWVGRMLVYSAKVFEPDTIAELIPQTQKGVALDGSEDLPAGAFFMGPSEPAN